MKKKYFLSTFLRTILIGFSWFEYFFELFFEQCLLEHFIEYFFEHFFEQCPLEHFFEYFFELIFEAQRPMKPLWMRKVPEKHGKCVNADHVVCVAVREEELVGRYNPTLALYTVKPDK